MAITAPPMSPEIPTATPTRAITTPTIKPVEQNEAVLSDSTLQLSVGKRARVKFCMHIIISDYTMGCHGYNRVGVESNISILIHSSYCNGVGCEGSESSQYDFSSTPPVFSIPQFLMFAYCVPIHSQPHSVADNETIY